MKKSFILSLLLYGCCSVWAQHWMGVIAEADMAWQLDKMPETTTKLGGGGGIGVVYQFKYNHFTVETGVAGKYINNSVGVADTLLQFDMIDTKGTPFVYKGHLKDRVDASQNLSVNVPLMLGIEYNYFYGIIGAKMNFNILSITRQTAQWATTGTYDIYYESLDNVPGHGFHDFIKEESSGKMKSNVDICVAAELGTVIYKNSNTKFRIGVFAEYGVLNTRKQESRSRLTIDVSEYMHVNMNHIYISSDATAGAIHNLYCGIRFSVLFSLNSKKTYYNHRYPCRCEIY